MEWGFAPASIRAIIDGPSKKLKVEGKEVLILTCVDGCLKCDWAETWRVWDDFQKSTELKALIDAWNKKLSGGGKGEGKSKGK